MHPGAYYGYLDIETVAFGFDNTYLYSKFTRYAKGSTNDVHSDQDFRTFASGTKYNIILGDEVNGEANGS